MSLCYVITSPRTVMDSTPPVMDSTLPVMNSTLPVMKSTLPVMESTPSVMDSTPPVMDSTPPVMNLCYVITGRVDKSTGNYAINRLSMKIRVMIIIFKRNCRVIGSYL